MMNMQRKEMENENEARCYEEGMHRRAGLAPSSQTSMLIYTIMPRTVPEIREDINKANIPYCLLLVSPNLSTIHAK